MSWSAKGILTKQVNQEPSLEMEYEQTQTGNGEKESKVALNIIKDVVLSLFGGQEFGHGTFIVSLSGHANDNNKPKEGWVNDFFVVSISQHTPKTI